MSRPPKTAQRAVEVNPSLVDAQHPLAMMLIHFERYEEALVHLAEAERLAPRAFQQVFTFRHRSSALFGLGRLDAALEAANEALRLDPTAKYQLMTHTVLLQALGRTAEAQDMMRKTRRSVPGEPLEFWVGYARGSYMSETLFKSYSQRFIDVWNATPEEKAQ